MKDGRMYLLRKYKLWITFMALLYMWVFFQLFQSSSYENTNRAKTRMCFLRDYLIAIL